jgi:hypothetical protein
MNEWLMNDGPWLPGTLPVRGEAHVAGKLADLLVAAHDLVLAAHAAPLQSPQQADAIEAYARRVCDEVSVLLRGVVQ